MAALHPVVADFCYTVVDGQFCCISELPSDAQTAAHFPSAAIDRLPKTNADLSSVQGMLDALVHERKEGLIDVCPALRDNPAWLAAAYDGYKSVELYDEYELLPNQRHVVSRRVPRFPDSIDTLEWAARRIRPDGVAEYIVMYRDPTSRQMVFQAMKAPGAPWQFHLSHAADVVTTLAAIRTQHPYFYALYRVDAREFAEAAQYPRGPFSKSL